MQVQTCDSGVLHTNDLPDPPVSQTRQQAHVTEEWRQSQDVLYRLFTSSDPRELNEVVLGLVASGRDGTRVGLLRQQYYDYMDGACKQVMDCIEHDILTSNLEINTAQHRTVCHCLVLVAMSIESHFLSYIVLHTYNREALRSYLNGTLKQEMAKFLQGGFDVQHYKSSTHYGTATESTDVPFEVKCFVNNSRHLYALYCLPRKPLGTG